MALWESPFPMHTHTGQPHFGAFNGHVLIRFSLPFIPCIAHTIKQPWLPMYQQPFDRRVKERKVRSCVEAHDHWLSPLFDIFPRCKEGLSLSLIVSWDPGKSRRCEGTIIDCMLHVVFGNPIMQKRKNTYISFDLGIRHYSQSGILSFFLSNCVEHSGIDNNFSVRFGNL